MINRGEGIRKGRMRGALPPLPFLVLMLKYRLQFLGGLSGSVSALLFHLICYRGRYAPHKMKQNTWKHPPNNLSNKLKQVLLKRKQKKVKPPTGGGEVCRGHQGVPASPQPGARTLAWSSWGPIVCWGVSIEHCLSNDLSFSLAVGKADGDGVAGGECGGTLDDHAVAEGEGIAAL